MQGNVWEWTADWFNATYPTGNPVIDPIESNPSSYRVIRGGSWLDDGGHQRSAMRGIATPIESNRYYGLGLRVSLQKS